jgi:dipeptidyl aminopeptidase/acylaminoacyl peptidase
MRLVRLLILSYFSVVTPAALTQVQDGPLSVRDALSLLSFTNSTFAFDVSPDGHRVAYMLHDNRRTRAAETMRSNFYSSTGVPFYFSGDDIWVTDVSSGSARNLTKGEGTNWAPSWSPDGKYLAFYSDRGGKAQVWVWERSTDKLWPASLAVVHSYLETVCWLSDSRNLITKVVPEGMTLADLIKRTGEDTGEYINGIRDESVKTYRSPSPVEEGVGAAGVTTDTLLADLATIDVVSGRVRRIAHKVRSRWYALSPDGSRVAFNNATGYERNDSQQVLYDVQVTLLSDGSSRTIAAGVRLGWSGVALSWSPDGQWISFLEGGPLANGDCFLARANGELTFKVTSHPLPSFNDGNSMRPPLWDRASREIYLLSGNKVWRVSLADRTLTPLLEIQDRMLIEIIPLRGTGRFWSVDRKFLYVCARNEATKQISFYKVDVRTGNYIRLSEEAKSYGDQLLLTVQVSADRQSIFYLAEDVQHSPDIWQAELDFASRRQVTHVNKKFDGYTFGVSRLIEWKNADGELLRGALLLPSHYDPKKRYPVVVNVYGGATLSNSVNRFGLNGSAEALDNMQLLATRGYVVFEPDAPLRMGRPMRDLVGAILPGLDHLIDLGVADPERLGVMGHSYGGYSVLALIVQSTRFKAAICKSGAVDLIRLYTRMTHDGSAPRIGWTEGGQGRMAGSLWEFRDRYIENSPIFYLDKVSTPLLLVHGSEDYVIPADQADAVFVSLRRLGKQVEYEKYEGEGHILSDWSYAHQEHYCNRMIDWFADHLRSRSTSKSAH